MANNEVWELVESPNNCNLLDANGCIRLRKILKEELSVSRQHWLPKTLLREKELTTLKLFLQYHQKIPLESS